MNTSSTIGNNIRMWLKIRGMKQEELAKKLDVSNSYLSQLMNGDNEKINKNKKRIMAIAKHLQIEELQLYGNPMQVFNFTNSNSEGSSNVNSVQNLYQADSEILAQLKSILSSFNTLVQKLDNNKID